jgi:hypothetical protein
LAGFQESGVDAGLEVSGVSERPKDLGNLEIESDGSGTIIAAIFSILTQIYDGGIEIRILRLEL